MLASLDATAWATNSGGAGLVDHRRRAPSRSTEEGVVASAATGGEIPPGGGWRNGGETVDAAGRTPGACRAGGCIGGLRAMAGCPMGCPRLGPAFGRSEPPVAWVETPLKPATLATARLAEHLGPRPRHPPSHSASTSRLQPAPPRRLARSRHPAVCLRSRRREVRRGLLRSTCTGRLDVAIRRPRRSVLDSWPGGRVLPVGARRLRPEDSTLVTAGPIGPMALRLLRNCDVTRGTQLAQPHAPPQQPPPPTGAGSRAWVVPGVANVDSNLTVSSCPSGHCASLAASAIDRRTSDLR